MNMIREEKGMTLIVKSITRLTLGFILLYGIYIALNGHSAPGGGFVGGVIIALSFVHVMLAFGKEVALKRLRSHSLRLAISVAALAFLYIAMRPWHGTYSRLAVPLCEMIIVCTALFAIFVALVLSSKTDKDAE